MLRASARGPGKQLLDRTRGFVETGDFYSGFVSRDASGSRGFVLGTLWVRQMSRRHLERPETAQQEPLQEFQELLQKSWRSFWSRLGARLESSSRAQSRTQIGHNPGHN